VDRCVAVKAARVSPLAKPAVQVSQVTRGRRDAPVQSWPGPPQRKNKFTGAGPIRGHSSASPALWAAMMA